MQPSAPDLWENYFQLFAQQPSFEIDAAQLDQCYRALQGQIHPDKYAHLSEAEQRVAMQRSTQVNEAYQTLRNPLARARYLLSLQGVDTAEETNTAMQADFLMAQMEWREAIAEAGQAHELDELATRLRQETRELEAQLAVAIDRDKNYPNAAIMVRKLRFMEKLAESLHSAYDTIDNQG
ncbi:MAG: Fe-S protein assembly co-chaperone HscB [Pseudomonadota bacterium]